MTERKEHEGWACSIWMPICGAFFTIFGIGLMYGAASLYGDMGVTIFAIPSIVCFFAIMFWSSKPWKNTPQVSWKSNR
ncbi:MAG: hypothetical protein QMC78_01795 [Methanocellales archaeon]|nr:hypothetical protein [Methanocellales archaeon]